MKENPTLLLVATGGTISMVRERGESIPALTGAELLARTALASTFNVRVIDLIDEKGSETRLSQLAHCLCEEVSGQVDGVVVTHGTDTLEEVAYFVDEVVPLSVPVVFTGAMRPSWASDYDGVRNLENGLRIAATVSAEYGTLVTMHDAVFETWSVYKSDTTALDAFKARRDAPYGRILGKQITLTWHPVPRTRIGLLPSSLPTSVPILMMGIEDEGILLDGVQAGQIQGLVIAGMAAGSISPKARQRVLSLAEQGLPIVLCSSAVSGRTAEEHYYPHAYDDLRAAGVIIEDWLSPRKARIRLMISLGLNRPYVPFGREFVR